MTLTTEITGRKNVSLKKLTISDAERLALLGNDPSIGIYLRDVFPHPYAKIDAVNFIRAIEKNNLFHSWGIVTKGNLAGVISLTLQEDIYRHSAEIGFWLGKEFWGRGLMTEAVELVCNYGFAQLNIIRIYAAVFETNPASLRVLRKNNFVLEGIRTKAVIKNKELINDCMMAKIKT